MSIFAIIHSPEGRHIEHERAARNRAIHSVSGKILAELSYGTFAQIDDSAGGKLGKAGFTVLEFPDPGTLKVGNDVLDITRGRALQRDIPKFAKRGWKHYVVQFTAPPENKWLKALERAGLRVTGKLGTYGFVLEGEPEDVAAVLGAPHIAFIAPYLPEWRLSSNLMKATGRIKFVSVLIRPAEESVVVVKAI